MRHIFSANSIMLGSMGVAVMAALSGCEDNSQTQEIEQNKFLVVEQLSNGKYVIVEEMPTSGESRAIIRERDENGTIAERVLSAAEMKELADQEYQKMQSGNSELNSEPSGEGMGLAGTILAAAGGALLGNMIGNALMNNANVQKHQQASNRSAYARSATPSNQSTTSSKKSYFGGANKASTSSSSSYGG